MKKTFETEKKLELPKKLDTVAGGNWLSDTISEAKRPYFERWKLPLTGNNLSQKKIVAV